jgi:PIN domain nuclease of toxin-antitoxin system
MQYLIDTHVLIWWITEDKRLSPKAEELIRSHRNTLYWSAASSWEIAIKHALGSLEFSEPPEPLLTSELKRNHIDTLVINNAHAFITGRLPAHHKDLFDRLLIAQACIESLAIISNDPKLHLYDVDVLW